MGAGEVFWRLTALENAVTALDMIRFRCECGRDVVKRASSVRASHTRSCGCLRAETIQKHGLSKHPLYHIWKGILRRCENPADAGYEDYGGRGITVCERWRGMPDGFLNFVADVGERPPGHTSDRPDNDRGYGPDNFAWKTPKEQNANRRRVRAVTRERDALAARVAELEALLGQPLQA